MEHCPLDPYEQELFKVFAHYDPDNIGSLDREGLSQLCNTLQLQDKYDNLLKILLVDENTRVTFMQFKDALLRVLGNMQNTADLDVSPEREVAPKYVCGSKKYGRRSKPRVDRIEESPASPPNIQRSNSTRESPNGKKHPLKRCTSVPSIPDGDVQNDLFDDVCTEEMLREAWRKLGVGDDGFLNHAELNLVCEAIGLNKLADSVMKHVNSKSVLDFDRKISFQELLEALQQDDTWNEFLNSTSNHNNNQSTLGPKNVVLNLADTKIVQTIKLGPDGTGFIDANTLSDLWESAGIASGKSLLNELGFNSSKIDVQKLSIVLESELKGLVELRVSHSCSPSVALLLAFLTLYQCEIKCLKSILQQICEEKEKLKFDISEANNRSSLLAQEVDENVAKLEEKTQKQIKQLELRHAELTKELKVQYASEKEQLNLSNHALEEKIKELEMQEEKLRENLSSSQNSLKVAESENQDLNKKIVDLESDKLQLKKCIEDDRLKALDAEKQAFEELERKVAILEILQRENSELKDKNDEMISQIESLHRELSCIKQRNNEKESTDFESFLGLEGIAYANKRRSDESSSDDFEIDSAISGSPRLGKMRKFQDQTDLAHAVDQYDFSEKISALNDLIKKAVDVPQTNNFGNDCRSYIKYLEYAVEKLLKQPSGKSTVEEKENFLQNKCVELEEALTLLKDEYDECEDYWQKKLEEERRIYEQEHLQSSEKLNEVIAKLQDYEEQFLRENKALSTIEETAALEKQYTDLEAEYEDVKEQLLKEVDEKQLLITQLEAKIFKDVADGEVQTEGFKDKLSIRLLENTNLYSYETTPSNSDESAWNSLQSQPLKQQQENVLEVAFSTPKTLQMPIKQRKNRQRLRALNRNLTKNEVQSDSSDGHNENNSSEMQQSKSQQNEVHSLKCKVDYLQKRCKSLQMRLREQQRYDEQLFQHYWYIHNAEKAEMEQYAKICEEKLQQQMRFVQEQQERLARGDKLVKELYVENSYLFTQNQRLDQQLKMFTARGLNI